MSRCCSHWRRNWPAHLLLVLMTSHAFLLCLCFYSRCTMCIARFCDCDCMVSVCPSVTLVNSKISNLCDHNPVDCDHIGWKSWKLIARTISPTPSLFGPQTPSTYFQENMGKFWGDKRSGGKNWRTKTAISQKRVKIEVKLLWRAYRKSCTLFRTVPSPTVYGLPFPKIGFRPCLLYTSPSPRD